MLKIILVAVVGALAGAVGISRFLLHRASRVREVFIAIGLAVLSVLLEKSLEVLFGLEDPEILVGPTLLLWFGIAAFIGAVVGVAIAFGAGRWWIVAVLAIVGTIIGYSIGGMATAALLGLILGVAVPLLLPKRVFVGISNYVYYPLAICVTAVGMLLIVSALWGDLGPSTIRDGVLGNTFWAILAFPFIIAGCFIGLRTPFYEWEGGEFLGVFVVGGLLLALAVLAVAFAGELWTGSFNSFLIVLSWLVFAVLLVAFKFMHKKDYPVGGVLAVPGAVLASALSFKLGSILQDFAVPDPIIGGMFGALLGSAVVVVLWLRWPANAPTKRVRSGRKR